MVAERRSASFKDLGEGGGLLDNATVTWTEVRAVMWDYQGKAPKASPAIAITMEPEEGEEVTQYYSVGKTEDWEPSEDGRKLYAVGNASMISKSSNYGILFKSLMDAGFPEDRIGDDLAVFDGLKCHMVRVPAPKRPGLAPRSPRADGKEYEATVLVVDKIESLPGEVSEDSGADDVGNEATAAIMEILGDKANAKGMDTKKLAGFLFQKVKDSPNRNEIIKLVYNKEFMAAGPWSFDPKKSWVKAA